MARNRGSGEQPGVNRHDGNGRNERGRGVPTDPVDQAIAAAAQPAQIEMLTLNVRLGTGKPAVLVIPKDFTALDALCLQKAVIEAFDQLDAMRAKSPAIYSPSGVVLASRN